VVWLDTDQLGKLVRNEAGKLVPECEVNCPADQPLEHPLEGIATPFQKIRRNEPLLDEDYKLLVTLVDGFVTVSTHGPIVGDDVAKIAKEVNTHKHTATCTKTGCSTCRFRYPRPPAPYTIISRALPDDMPDKDKREKRKYYGEILAAVENFVQDVKKVGQVMTKHDKNLETTPELHRAGKLARIKMMCEEAKINYNDYIEAITFCQVGYSIVLERDLDEVFVNNYNAEYLRAWNGNMDLQIVLDFFAVTTYVVEYISKDDTAVAKKMREALKDDKNLDLREKLKKAGNLYMQFRQMGEAEACYRLLPELRLKNSNVSTQFISTGLKDERSTTFRKATEKQLNAGVECIKLEGHEGLWYVQPDFWSKYLRRPDSLEDMCFAQFARMYRGQANGKKDEDNPADNDIDVAVEEIDDEDRKLDDEDSKFHFVMTHLDNGGRGLPLPEVIQLKNPVPGELHVMVKRKFPVALRFHKVKAQTQPERFMAKELMMYRPMRGELDEDSVLALYSEEYDGKAKVTLLL